MATSAAAPIAVPGLRRTMVTICAMTATIMQALDTTIANVALPYMQGSLSPGTGAQFAILPPQNASGNFVKVVQRVPVRIYFDANDKFVRKLKAGMSVYATIDTKHQRSLATLLGFSPAVANSEHE